MENNILSGSVRDTTRIFQLCAVCLLLLCPFLNKPFHIDDPLYIWTAQQIRAHPLDFHGFHKNWEGHDQPASQFFENPPLTSYLLAGVSCFADFNRIAFHLAFLIFNLLSVIGMYLLAGQFCRRPFLAAFLLLFCPAFLVSATTIMCEPLLICFWIWAIYLWIAGTQRCASLCLLAGAVTLAAVLTKFMAICIVPLMIFYSVCIPAPSRHRWVQAFSIALPIIGAIAYELFTRRANGIGGFAGAAVYVASAHLVTATPTLIKLLNTFCFTGGCCAACVAMLPLIFPRWLTCICVLGIAGLTLLAAEVFQAPSGWSSAAVGGRLNGPTSFGAGIAFYGQLMLWLVGGIGLGSLFGICLLRSVRQKCWRTEAFLLFWAAGIFIFTALINWSINARSLLPMLPPVCILVVRSLDSLVVLPRVALSIMLGVSALLGFAVAQSDSNLAITIQDAATALPVIARTYAPPGSTLWFTGHWGFQYYMEQSGARPVDDVSPQMKIGEIIVYPVSGYGGIPVSSGLLFIRRVQVGAAHDAATAHANLGAEFYASYGYGLPFVFGPIAPEAFDLVRVTPRTRVRG